MFKGDFVLFLAQLLDGEEAADDVGLVGKLGEKHFLVGLEVNLSEHSHFRVEAHDLGCGPEGQVEVLTLL